MPAGNRTCTDLCSEAANPSEIDLSSMEKLFRDLEKRSNN
jgi:hypothetical protein